MALSTSGISFAGLASGIDSTSIIAALMKVRHLPIDALNRRRGEFQTQQGHLTQLRDLVQGLRSAVEAINTSGEFAAFSAASSNENVLRASASGSASPGSFVVTVGALAKAEVEGSNGFADVSTTSVGTGTISLTVAGQQKNITIASGHDTLEGIRDAINDSKSGVTATIVNTGNGATPYQLVVQGQSTGATNTIAIDLSQFTGTLSFTEKQAAADSSITINGITAKRSTNVVSDVVGGVTLTLNDLGTSTVTLTPDASKIRDKVKAFVDARNALVGFVNAESKYDPTTKHSGPLAGDGTLRTLMSALSRAQSGAGYPGGGFSVLSQVGITLNSDGTLNLDAAKFDAAATDHLQDLTALFTTVGDRISGANFSIAKVPDTVAAGTYAVNVTQAATRAQTTIATQFANGGVLAANEALTITQGGKTATVQLAAGDNISAALSKINKALKAAKLTLTGSDATGALKFTADGYGSAQAFTVVSDAAAGTTSSGVGTTQIAASAVDVQGTIGGVAATGAGQTLTGTAAFAGLKITYSGTTVPSSGSLTVGPDGFFTRTGQILDSAVNAADGTITTRLNGVARTISDIAHNVDDLEGRLDDYQKMLQTRFAKLEEVMAKLQSSQSYLTAIAGQKFGG